MMTIIVLLVALVVLNLLVYRWAKKAQKKNVQKVRDIITDLYAGD